MPLCPRPCLLLLLLLSVPATLAESTCENNNACKLSCEGCTPNEKVPDPENCRGYYVCEKDTVEGYYGLSFECGDDEVFDAATHECKQGDSCEPCDSASLQSCSYECKEGTEARVASFTDCHNFYACSTTGTITPMTCNATMPYFDGQECQTDETRCCHCHAYCPSTAATDPGFIADPLDCRKYYLCTTADASAVATISGTCPEGKNFDSFLEGCSASAPCITQCKNVVGTDGCIEPFTCQTTGYFARCPGRCTPDYYHCTAATGEYQDFQSCTGGTVFHPDSHTCVTAGYCPYPLV